jgi:integrase
MFFKELIMPRVAERLTVRGIQTASKKGLHADGKGLYLRVSETGTKSWVYRYRVGDRQHDMGLGPYPDISLAEARERATAQRRLRLDGLDPLTEKRSLRASQAAQRAKAMNFRQCAEKYIEAHSAGWRGVKQLTEWNSTLTRFAYPVIGSLPVQAIDVALVMRVLEPIWTVKPETASRVRQRIEAILGWATARGFRSGDNPARWRDHLANLLPAPSKVAPTEHHPALPYPEIASFITELQQQESIGARALEFAILTAARAGEVLGAKWGEINLAERLWTISGARMKEGKEHRVPLSASAMAILKMQEIRLGDYVFPGRNGSSPLGKTTVFKLLRRMGRGALTMHGFRSTFRDWCAERTNFPREVAELALAHSVGSEVERAYQRGDLFQKRRQIMDAWARFCTAPAMAGKVVAIGASR